MIEAGLKLLMKKYLNLTKVFCLVRVLRNETRLACRPESSWHRYYWFHTYVIYHIFQLWWKKISVIGISISSILQAVAMSKTTIKPQSLAPTKSATKYHSMQVHLQVNEWKTLMSVELNPLDWWWKLSNGLYCPYDGFECGSRQYSLFYLM